MVVIPDIIVNPRAVVIELCNASVHLPAVLAPQWPPPSARHAHIRLKPVANKQAANFKQSDNTSFDQAGLGPRCFDEKHITSDRSDRSEERQQEVGRVARYDVKEEEEGKGGKKEVVVVESGSGKICIPDKYVSSILLHCSSSSNQHCKFFVPFLFQYIITVLSLFIRYSCIRTISSQANKSEVVFLFCCDVQRSVTITRLLVRIDRGQRWRASHQKCHHLFVVIVCSPV
mmetsp:Transcript_40547/g.105244  ORF Transcript_40547/g.105244 Transcript_40547/m.105244 type:complete len:230 (-) Transcript_40547:738-1427(-)